MITLGIDTTNQTLAVGVVDDQTVLGQVQINIKKNYNIILMPTIKNLFSTIQLTPKDIDRIVVSDGPGSYTGLRIGVTTAKTLAYTLKKELVGVSSLKVIAKNCSGVQGIIVPLFDARRNNVYAGAYQFNNDKLETILEDVHIAMDELLEELSKKYVSPFFVGSDCQKFLSDIKIKLPYSIINENLIWNIPNGATTAQLGVFEQPVDDIQSFLPRYLKRVEAEEKWLETHQLGEESYVEKFKA